MISQDINQLKSREIGYGPDETITSNCHVQCAFPPNRLGDRGTFVKADRTNDDHQRAGHTIGTGLRGSSFYHDAGGATALLTSDECLRMPGPKKDAQGLITEPGDMVVYCAGFPAIYGPQPLYFQDETFAVRAGIPPPKRSDSLSTLPVPEVKIV